MSHVAVTVRVKVMAAIRVATATNNNIVIIKVGPF